MGFLVDSWAAASNIAPCADVRHPVTCGDNLIAHSSI